MTSQEQEKKDKDWFWEFFAAQGRLIKRDGGAFVMYPQAKEISRQRFKELEKEGKTTTTSLKCAYCNIVYDICHTAEYKINIQECPKCKKKDWRI